MRIGEPLAALGAVLLCACASNVQRSPSPAPARDWIGEIRREAAKVPSAVHVMPLADPAVDDLRRRAVLEFDAGRFGAAADVLRQAIGMRDGDPTLLQSLAEAELAQARWNEAEAGAQRSYDLGPKVGELCVRNWLTVFASRIERGDAVGAASARAQVQNCVVDALNRF